MAPLLRRISVSAKAALRLMSWEARITASCCSLASWLEEFEEIDLVVQVEKCVGLVEEQDAGFLDEAAGEEDALALAAGEVVDGAGRRSVRSRSLAVF
jgi:hypothetical protein